MMRQRSDLLPYTTKSFPQHQPYSFHNRKLSSSNNKSSWNSYFFSRSTTKRRLLFSGLFFIALCLFWIWKRFELHVELALYNRGWVRDSVETIRPLSGTCFNKENMPGLESNYVDPAPGLALRFDGDCYDYSNLVPHEPLPGMRIPEFVSVHLYWRPDLRPIGDREVLAIQSILVTQPQHFQVRLWTTDANTLTQAPQLARLLHLYPDRLSIHQVNFVELAKGTPLQDSPRLNNTNDKLAYLDGDVVRLLLLYNFGGIWIDMDYIILRRLDVLLENEWVQQWDCYDKPYQPLNGAMMYFRQHSPYMCEMLHIIATDPLPRKLSTDWGSLVYHKLWRRLVHNGIHPFKILPFCFTDARSCRLDTRLPDPFAPDPPYHKSKWDQLEQRLNSIFAIHLHNQWDKTFPPGGWVDRYVLKRINERIRQ